MTRYLLLTSVAGSWALLALAGVVLEHGTLAWESSDSARGAALVATVDVRPPAADPSAAEAESRPPAESAPGALPTNAASTKAPTLVEVPPTATPPDEPKPTKPAQAEVTPATPKNAIDDTPNRPNTKATAPTGAVATR